MTNYIKRFLFAWLRPTPPFFLGGAEVSLRILAQQLVKSGYQVQCLGSYAHPRHNTWDRLHEFCDYLGELGVEFKLDSTGGAMTYNYNKIQCVMVPQEKIMEQLLNEFERGFDLVITGQEQSDRIVNLANEAKIKTVAWIHSPSPTGLLSLKARPQYILCTSKFVKQKVVELYKRYDALLFYPPFDLVREKNSQLPSKSYITFVNPIAPKGVDIFLRLTQAFTERSFMAVESWCEVKIPSNKVANNIRYIPRQFSLLEIFKNTRIILVPSQIEEGFGRVVTEAGLLGIPSIASAIGGLPEAVGNGGILIKRVQDIDEWMKAIRIMDDEKVYSKYSLQSKIQAKRFLRDSVQELREMMVI